MFAFVLTLFAALVVSTHAFTAMRPAVRSMALQAKAKAEVSPSTIIEVWKTPGLNQIAMIEARLECALLFSECKTSLTPSVNLFKCCSLVEFSRNDR